ncbi:MAG: hypothetical protein KDD64_13505 [Bdellovibrionales bacterium]|nr:hypothetical protein [Bdellovibrionales bacterium]
MDTQANHKLVEAYKNLQKKWIPVNSDLLSRIQEGLASGAYDLDIDFLVSEVKTDISLFTYCLRETKRKLDKKAQALPSVVTPVSLLKSAGLQMLREVLQVDPDHISAHELDRGKDLGLSRFRECVISSSAAEVLSERRNLVENLGFSTEIMRQLGLTLIAWNYTDSFREAMAAHKEGKNLDLELTKLLGFSPSLLGIAMARQWGLSPELRLAIGDHQAAKNLPAQKAFQVKKTAETLSKLCEVGEALARANHPDLYPSANSDWESARKSIGSILGEDGIHFIQDKVKENCVSYIAFAPEIFSPSTKLNPERFVPEVETPSESFGGEVNPYVRYCPAVVHEKFQQFYNNIRSSENVDREHILYLVKEIIPQAGFPRGCIFLLEPDQMKLYPRLKVGDVRLDQFKVYHALSMNTRSPNPVLSAYHCNSPIVESSNSLTPEGGSCIASVLGKNQRVGVLYLEPSEDLMKLQDGRALQRFKALRLAFEDCLRLQ